jgi:hypothetical protein
VRNYSIKSSGSGPNSTGSAPERSLHIKSSLLKKPEHKQDKCHPEFPIPCQPTSEINYFSSDFVKRDVIQLSISIQRQSQFEISKQTQVQLQVQNQKSKPLPLRIIFQAISMNPSLTSFLLTFCILVLTLAFLGGSRRLLCSFLTSKVLKKFFKRLSIRP